jgi:hypothetical protein
MKLHSNRSKGGKVVEEPGDASEDEFGRSPQAEGGEGTAEGDGEAGEEGKKVIEYRSRNTMRYDIEDSQDEGSGGEEGPDPTLAKTSLAYLNQEKRKLEREMERNAQMVEVEQQKKALGANSDQDIKPNKRFKNFNDVFSGLTRSKNVVTAYPIISCIMTYNSRSAITVTKASDREYWVKQYSLESNQQTFEEKIGSMDPKEIADPNGPYNGREPYIKLKEVQQNATGEQFAIAYLDDGRFRLRTFGEVDRTREEIRREELDINAELGLGNDTMPINNFPDPFIATCFVTDDLLFVNLFHNADLTHHHFFYSRASRALTQKTQI